MEQKLADQCEEIKLNGQILKEKSQMVDSKYYNLEQREISVLKHREEIALKLEDAREEKINLLKKLQCLTQPEFLKIKRQLNLELTKCKISYEKFQNMIREHVKPSKSGKKGTSTREGKIINQNRMCQKQAQVKANKMSEDFSIQTNRSKKKSHQASEKLASNNQLISHLSKISNLSQVSNVSQKPSKLDFKNIQNQVYSHSSKISQISDGMNQVPNLSNNLTIKNGQQKIEIMERKLKMVNSNLRKKKAQFKERLKTETRMRKELKDLKNERKDNILDKVIASSPEILELEKERQQLLENDLRLSVLFHGLGMGDTFIEMQNLLNQEGEERNRGYDDLGSVENVRKKQRKVQEECFEVMERIRALKDQIDSYVV